MRTLGVQELLVIGAIAVLLFGGRRVGELGKGLGDAVREFKRAGKDAEAAKDELKKA